MGLNELPSGRAGIASLWSRTSVTHQVISVMLRNTESVRPLFPVAPAGNRDSERRINTETRFVTESQLLIELSESCLNDFVSDRHI